MAQVLEPGGRAYPEVVGGCLIVQNGAMPSRRQIIDDRLYAHSFEIYERTKLEEKLQYMHENPVRARLVERPSDWRWSSARWYEWRRTVGVPIHWIE